MVKAYPISGESSYTRENWVSLHIAALGYMLMSSAFLKTPAINSENDLDVPFRVWLWAATPLEHLARGEMSVGIVSFFTPYFVSSIVRNVEKKQKL